MSLWAGWVNTAGASTVSIPYAGATEMNMGGLGGGQFGSLAPYQNVSSTSFTPPWELPKPQLVVARIVCWKCAKAEGKFLYQPGMGLTWCEECYVVMQLSVPTSTP